MRDGSSHNAQKMLAESPRLQQQCEQAMQRADAETKEKEKIQCQKEAIKKVTNRLEKSVRRIEELEKSAQTSEAGHAKLLAEIIERSAKLQINLKTECAKQIMHIQAENTRLKDSAETSEAEKERLHVKFVGGVRTKITSCRNSY